MERMQPKELSLFKASDGTAAVDMSVALVSEPIPSAAPGAPPNGKPANGKGAPFTEKVS